MVGKEEKAWVGKGGPGGRRGGEKPEGRGGLRRAVCSRGFFQRRQERPRRRGVQEKGWGVAHGCLPRQPLKWHGGAPQGEEGTQGQKTT